MCYAPFPTPSLFSEIYSPISFYTCSLTPLPHAPVPCVALQAMDSTQNQGPKAPVSQHLGTERNRLVKTWESVKLDQRGVPPPCTFGTLDLNHPDTGQAACGLLLSLFDAHHCPFSFDILLNLFSGMLDIRGCVEGTHTEYREPDVRYGEMPRLNAI